MTPEELRSFWMISVLAINGTNLLFTIIIPLTTWILVKVNIRKKNKGKTIDEQIKEYELEIKKIQLKNLQKGK